MFWEKNEIETNIIQLNQSKNQKIILQNLRWRNFQNRAFGFSSTMYQTKIHFFDSLGRLAYWTRRNRF